MSNKIIKNMIDIDQDQNISGILKQVNTLDGKRLISKRGKNDE